MMDREDIEEMVSDEIEIWSQEKEVEISPEAIEFITTLIDNMGVDPSPIWGELDDVVEYQKSAISRIPGALNEVLNRNRRIFNQSIKGFRASGINPRIRLAYEIKTVSTWEIYRTLSPIILDFCFIPREKMK